MGRGVGGGGGVRPTPQMEGGGRGSEPPLLCFGAKRRRNFLVCIFKPFLGAKCPKFFSDTFLVPDHLFFGGGRGFDPPQMEYVPGKYCVPAVVQSKVSAPRAKFSPEEGLLLATEISV